MAMAAESSPPTTTPPPQSISSPAAAAQNKLPSNPTPLSAPQEQQVRDLYYKNVRSKCAEEIKAFAACATGRTFTMVWACRGPKLAMNSCMLRHQGQEEFDRARAEWFAAAGERRREREERERRVEEARKKHREWWGLDEMERRSGEEGQGKGEEKGR